MNYELGMHCTGFEFAYCCVLPPYNSIIAQVVKTQRSNSSGDAGQFAKLIEGDPNVGKDALGRETVLRDPDLDNSGKPQKYVLVYHHDAQPRNDGRGKPQSSTLISAEEGNSLFMWSTAYDRAAKNANGSLKTGNYDGATGVVIGDGVYDANDSYANGWMNHLYIYSGLEGANPNNTSLESAKIRLGVDLVVPPDCGPAFNPMGPVTEVDPFNPGNPATKANDCGGNSRGNVLTFSGNTGTVVYTQMKVLENLPVTLTSPRIWEALGLPLKPFEDSINFFADPGLVTEETIRPYPKMTAQLYFYDAADTSTTDGDPAGVGAAVLINNQPVIGFGAAPIDIPNCERCHSNQAATPNSPNTDPAVDSLVVQEKSFWDTYYNINTGAGDSDWYSRLKSAAISMLKLHDMHNGTSFTANYPAASDLLHLPANKAAFPQNTRIGHESVICQKCHADNVIAVVKSATCATGNTKCTPGTLIKPVSEAIHKRHRSVTETWNGVPGNDHLQRRARA